MTAEVAPEAQEETGAEASTRRKGEGKGIEFDPELYIMTFKGLVDSGKYKEQICEEMHLSELKYYKLIHALSIKENRVIQVPSYKPGRGIKVRSNGIALSLAKIASLGLKDVFAVGTPVKTIRKDDTIVIKRADAK